MDELHKAKCALDSVQLQYDAAFDELKRLELIVETSSRKDSTPGIPGEASNLELGAKDMINEEIGVRAAELIMHRHEGRIFSNLRNKLRDCRDLECFCDVLSFSTSSFFISTLFRCKII